MARPRKTTESDAIHAAMLVFWQNGYHQSGTRKIEQETGMTRFLLQREYGGKQALFFRTLDHYLDLVELDFAPPSKPESIQQLAAWFGAGPEDHSWEPIASNGCFLISSHSELSEEEAFQEEMTKRTDRFFGLMRARLGAALRHLQDKGALRKDLNPEMVIEVLLALILTKSVRIRSAHDVYAAAYLIGTAEKLLESWASN